MTETDPPPAPERARIEVPDDPRDLPGDFPHRFRVTIRFGDTDAMGHTNNSRFLTFCESARIDYWEVATGEPFAVVTHGAEESLILAEIRVTYRSPSYFGEPLVVESRVGRLGRTSFTLEHRVTAPGSARGATRLVATAEDVLVLYDYATERPRPIPDDLVARLEAFEGSPPAVMTRPCVELRDITSDADWDAVMGLRLGPGQEAHLNSMPEIRQESIEDARAMPHPWSVHDADTGELVGFAMISDNIPEPIDDDLVGPYFLWKLLIDHAVQGRGYGQATLDAVVDYVAGRPGAALLPTSCADGPHSPRGFYLRYGFNDTGRVMWGENVLALDIATRRTAGTP